MRQLFVPRWGLVSSDGSGDQRNSLPRGRRPSVEENWLGWGWALQRERRRVGNSSDQLRELSSPVALGPAQDGHEALRRGELQERPDFNSRKRERCCLFSWTDWEFHWCLEVFLPRHAACSRVFQTIKQEKTWCMRTDSAELLQGLLSWVRAQWEAMFGVKLHTILQDEPS